MEEREEIEKELNDVQEDHREEGESIYDDLKAGGSEEDKHLDNEIAEDHREEGESIDDLKVTIESLLARIKELEDQLAQAHNTFLGSGEDVKEEKRTYSSIVRDIQ